MQSTFLLHNESIEPEPEMPFNVDIPIVHTPPTILGQPSVSSGQPNVFGQPATNITIPSVAPLVIDHAGHDYTMFLPENEPIGILFFKFEH